MTTNESVSMLAKITLCSVKILMFVYKNFERRKITITALYKNYKLRLFTGGKKLSRVPFAVISY